ncbi:MAG: cytochrome c biogenesis protein CcsA [Desulfovibrio sp.]|nr:cytochrome c biogenesis protein CcsA [Desulfovibrio sp.]
MYLFAYIMQATAMITAICGAALALLDLWQGRCATLRLVEKAHWIVTGGLALAAALLLHALFWQDYGLKYVADYTDNLLPVFYRLTAFWAGQQGSMLFWALMVAMGGTAFALTRAANNLLPATRLWFWAFFYCVMAFFGLILTSFSNPFIMQTPAPADGGGLNPLLQHPGMIIHPPLLFLGYGGFTVPACLALAQCLAGKRAEESAWFILTRPFLLGAWIFLTAGILLGAWWAYLELGWGGYWAWDPVENASLVPWLVATAALHTIILQERRGKLARANVYLMVMTMVSAFFATFLVRSGVIDSVHAFGNGPVGLPLAVFVISATAIAIFVPLATRSESAPLEGLASREGMLTLVPWFLLALGAIIITATMWPVISRIWSPSPAGLDASFYNKVCLPLATLLLVIMAACPWLGWKGGLRSKGGALAALLVFSATAAGVWTLGYREPVPLVATAAAASIAWGAVLLAFCGKVGIDPRLLGAFGTHLGIALATIGIAFSGPYSIEKDVSLASGASETVGGYTLTLKDISVSRHPGYEALTGVFSVARGGDALGTLAPERRIYDKFGSMQFSQVDTIPGPGDELYASLMGMDDAGRAHLRFSIKPLVNWLWVGGAIMSLLPLMGLARRRKRDDGDGNAGTAGNDG